MEHAKTVDELCAEKGIDAAKLASLANLDEARVKAIAEGRWTPSPAERDRIAAAFGLTRDEIAWGHKTIISHIHGHGPQFGRSP
ncbi:MAG: helix-turn-helix transcriptional regulator [Planctomycetes bacterium]|nr:helix-turn-helix transcriptional regulator [Planctomycetota bacterium]